MRRTDIVTSAVFTPRSLSSASSSRAPGRKGTPVVSRLVITVSVRWSMIAGTSIRTPAP
jgi:hypothetical protein